MYLNWYSKKLINFKGKFVGGDATAVFRANNGTTAEVGFGFGTDNDTGFYKTNNNRISISTDNAFRGFMSGGISDMQEFIATLQAAVQMSS